MAYRRGYSVQAVTFLSLLASVRHTDAPSGLPRVLSWLGRLSCRNTGSQLNGRHSQSVNAYPRDNPVINPASGVMSR